MENDTNRENRKEIMRRADRSFFSKLGFIACLMILGAVVIISLLQQIQRKAADEELAQECRYGLTKTVSILERDLEEAEELSRGFHQGNQNMLEMLCTLFTEGKFGSVFDEDIRTATEGIQSMTLNSGVDSLNILSMDGSVLVSSREELTGVDLVRSGRLGQESMDSLMRGTRLEDGTAVPILVENIFGQRYYYSSPCRIAGTEYMVMLGADATLLESQLEMRMDFTALLERSAAWRDGFFFAVSTEDGTFLLYQNGETVLTGQDARACGLSEEALEEGYAGTQRIAGRDIFCMSQKAGGNRMIYAAADTEDVYSDRSYVLFWTVTGFVLVMLLCLTYTVIIRNDFVRHAVKTERKTLKVGKRILTLDLSIFRKVFPLLVSGVLMIFVISFYTGTLQDISETIEDSVSTLDEMSVLHSESVRNQESIRESYLTRYLSEARMLSFLLEEDPSFLNEETDRFYSTLSQDGDRVFLTDEEGNRLRSVAYSGRLQEICDRNGLSSLYIFNQGGHTIATNTDAWYYTLNRDGTSRSYSFQQLLEGRVDSWVMDPVVNADGSVVQYLAVDYYYFTTKSPVGTTVYVSYQDYLDALEKETPDHLSDVMEHRGMLEIGLNDRISRMLVDSAEIVNTFSSDMLSGGFVILFDKDDEHTCLYSPNEAQIGRPAEEFGYSDRAFSGDDYFCFTRSGGEGYFQYFRYTDQGYLATAIPKANMYQNRTKTALISALSSFVLILILICAVTLTSPEEEQLYEEASEDAESRLDMTIFQIMLPSGSRASTMKAEARWSGKAPAWSEKPPEQKLLALIGIVCFLLVMNIVIAAAGVKPWFNEQSLVRSILSGNWERGLNIFALTACMVVIMGAIAVVFLLRFPLRLLKSMVGARGETIGHLLLSVARYGGLIGCLFYCLYLIGIDSTSLLASAGVLSLVIGFGAQNLIKDILAGIFIVFEGEFRVGDIVTIDEFRGQVLEIGLRTTKILGMGGNIKIYNNSDITGLLNMTQDASYATCTASIEYGQDLEKVEEILRRELPKLKEQNPSILEGPEYLGVSSLGTSSVDLLILCKCAEEDIYSVRRYLNREVLMIFYRNGINVPFPNVTVSMLKDIRAEEKEQAESGSGREPETQEEEPDRKRS